MRDRGFDLHRLAITRVLQQHDAGFVLIAQRQMQSQIDIARQSHLLQGLLRRADGLFRSGILVHARLFLTSGSALDSRLRLGNRLF
ncbi:hypothetical protein SDC9_149357 [bioreactor metagenome]|uniref:Uncharacterized protein n=1 Tax=bioreactor metagenome TaxID=1076179 RepID=A0A645ENB9_9ZZZZ